MWTAFSAPIWACAPASSEWEAYKLRLARDFDFLGSFWDDIEGGVLLKRRKEMRALSLSAAASLPVITVHSLPRYAKTVDLAPDEWCIFVGRGSAELPKFFAERLFADRYPTSITIEKDGTVRSDWTKGKGNTIDGFYLRPFKGIQLLAATLYYTERSAGTALNSRHPLMLWLTHAQKNTTFNDVELRDIQNRITQNAKYPSLYSGDLGEYLESFKNLRNLPPSLAPPTITETDFLATLWQPGKRPAKRKKFNSASV